MLVRSSSQNKMPPMARPVSRGPPSKRRKGTSLEAQTRATIDQVRRELPRSVEDMERLPIYSILFIVGGFCAIGLGFLVFLVSLANPRGNFILNIAQLLVCLIFGFMLLWNYTQVKKAPRTAFVLGLVFGIILWFGGYGGVIGGLLGVIGAIILLIQTERLL